MSVHPRREKETEMHRRSRWTLVGLSLVIMAAVGGGALSTASAAPPHTTMKLSCDRTVSAAAASIQLRDSAGGAIGNPFDLSCGPASASTDRSQTFTLQLRAGAADVNVTVTGSGGSDTCIDGGALSLKLPCLGATLVVR
jgi:hypothetical protein